MNLNNGEGSLMTIHSNRLAVEIAAPGTVYQRTRFDWTGFITQVTLDGSHSFCVPEDYNPAAGTGGIGLCNEFGIEKAIGFNDADPGQTFPKLGIGLLTRPDEQPYNFFRAYEIAQPFPIHIETAHNQVRFVVDPLDCRGYALRSTKTLSVEGNCLQIAYHLENVGSRPVATHEYCHNFVAIDRQPVGPGYRLLFPYPVTFGAMHEAYRGFLPRFLQGITPGFILKRLVKSQLSTDVLDVDDRQVSWKFTPGKPFYCRPQGFSQTSQPQWELTYTPSGISMREYDDFPPERVALWGAAHVISTEIFNDIHLPPGQSQSWTRRYEFIA